MNPYTSPIPVLTGLDIVVVVSIGNCIIVNLYLPCVGTNDRLCIIDEVLHDVSEWMFEFRDCVTFIGGDFNTDLDVLIVCAAFWRNKR